MDRQLVAVLGVAALVLMAGCATLVDQQEGEGTTVTESPGTTAATTADSTTSATTTESSTATTEQTTDGSTTTSSTATTTTTAESWSSPEEPNEPLQIKYGNGTANHIKSVAVDGEGSSAEGYSSVELTVTANTSMENVDPASHGTVEGEPFILVYVDGHLATAEDSNFATPRGVLVSRTDTLPYNDPGEYTVSVPQEAFEASGVESGEETELMVMVMDRDSDWDDIYGKQFVNVTYQAN